jgi:thiol-disulfide isomerase/thioredoxin
MVRNHQAKEGDVVRTGISLLVALAIGTSLSPVTAADPPAPVGTRVTDFTLPDTATGKPWSFADHTRTAKATVVLFLGAGCPACNAYLSRLTELHKRYSDDGVVFVAVNSQADDDAVDVAKQAKDAGLPFPMLKDDGTKLADKLAAERIPTAFVLDAAKTVRYKGRIDDQFSPGVQRAKATTRELGNAIDAVLEGREVTVPFTAAAGCLITREKPAKAAAGEPVTYHKHVARITQARCQECHRPGEAGPFPLTSYKQVKGWADMIREVVTDGVMPPWHADAPPGHFKNDRRLTPAEKTTLLAWLDQGCPEGDPKDAPEPPKYIDGWRLGREPDEVLRMQKPTHVPASGFFGWGMPYQYVMVGDPLPEDKWVTGVEVRPEYRAVVHHIIAFIIPPGGGFRDIAGPKFGEHMLGAFVPGDQPTTAPPGMARKLQKGSRILFEVHYTPNGKPGDDRSMVGLTYTDRPPEKELVGMSIMNNKFRIPPGAEAHEVQSVHEFEKESTILAMAPHMHLRGKSFKYELVTQPDPSVPEKREVLLNLPRYDFNWQVSYILAKPRTVPAGAKLVCTAVYDNSAKNPFNPDPGKLIRWGNQTWEEMMIGFISYHVGR